VSWRGRALVLLLIVGCAGCGLGKKHRRLATDKPGKGSLASGLNWQCGLLGGGLGALAGAGLSLGGTALVNEEWPLNDAEDWVHTLPIWGSAIFTGATLGLFIACLGLGE